MRTYIYTHTHTHTCRSVSVSIPHDFDYGKYLKKTLAHSYAHIIEISPVDWVRTQWFHAWFSLGFGV